MCHLKNFCETSNMFCQLSVLELQYTAVTKCCCYSFGHQECEIIKQPLIETFKRIKCEEFTRWEHVYSICPHTLMFSTFERCRICEFCFTDTKLNSSKVKFSVALNETLKTNDFLKHFRTLVFLTMSVFLWHWLQLLRGNVLIRKHFIEH